MIAIGSKIIMLGMAIVMLSSCRSASRHQESLTRNDKDAFTLGNVQRKVQVGMSQADVASALGSPNMVTRDPNGKESWVYDKIGSEVSYSQDNGGVWLILGTYEKNAGASRSTQKTLTVVIRFNEHNVVENVVYHSSQF